MTGINSSGGFGANFDPNKGKHTNKDTAAQPAQPGEKAPLTSSSQKAISADDMLSLMANQAQFGRGVTAAGLSISASMKEFENTVTPEQFSQLQTTFGQAVDELGLSSTAADVLTEEALANYLIGIPSATA